MIKTLELKKGNSWYTLNYDGTEEKVLLSIAEQEFGGNLDESVFEDNSAYSVLENLGWEIIIHDSYAA